ncbi:MAG TPA: bifunctional phosphoribosylaminoimidazolecarboxamide formyltransferase/IMP cyclohydrolase [Candidatus Dormibacteraeota bacterium]|nr:bifunctional phosphoribosylaminoimidazolecarboxamide formyltransferase/IMP cyclohydrolase [Candidatus Dormibacteraeota bacterium]
MPKRALLSVSNKGGLPAFARGLARLGYELYSTGATQRALEEASLDVHPVSELTDFPEILGGRLKTLHPGVHGGLLARRGVPEDVQQLEVLGLRPIDLLCVNLYPFADSLARPGTGFSELLEQIDVGGVAMVRAAAKNHADVIVVVRPERYSEVLTALQDGRMDDMLRRRLAAEAFAHTAVYDSQIAVWLQTAVSEGPAGFPPELSVGGQLARPLRYGENPHQSAAFYRLGPDPGGLGSARQLQGPELSYNNIQDAAAAYDLVAEFARPAVAIIKHTNPCGLALADDLATAYQRAYESDPQSAFGGVVAVNRLLDVPTAERIIAVKTDVVLAPALAPDAVEVLERRKGLRVLEVGPVRARGLQVRSVPGGFLAQDWDDRGFRRDACKVVSRRQPTAGEWEQLEVAWLTVKHVRSNAIVLVRDLAAVGVGAGQMSRVEAAEIAARRAGERASGSVMASDAFFPFADGVEVGLRAGATAVIQPGGSVRDPEVVAAVDAAGAAMVVTGERHFRH